MSTVRKLAARRTGGTMVRPCWRHEISSSVYPAGRQRIRVRQANGVHGQSETWGLGYPWGERGMLNQ
ncbi:MAG: hypothetical protein AB7U73_20645 [Pirellulales bacterium]